MTTFDHFTDKTGDITNTVLLPSSTLLEEESEINVNANDIDYCDILHLEDDDIASLSTKDAIDDESIPDIAQDEPITVIDPLSPHRLNRV